MNNTYLTIDFKQVEANLVKIAKGKKVCLMVKANNYGVGYNCISEFVKMGYNYFGVTTIEEADLVRAQAPEADILIVSYVDPSEYPKAIANNYTLTIYDDISLQTITKDLKYHLKFDTGMGRIGFFTEQIPLVKAAIEKSGNMPLGIYSHFPEAINEEFTVQQIKRFRKIVDQFTEFNFEFIHLQNSVSSQLYDLDFCNMIRPGIGIWGYYADATERDFVESRLGQLIKPALSLNVKVHMQKHYEGLIGYDLSEEVNGELATIRIGYHDGFNRRFNGYQFATGQKVVGKVCMCQAFVLTDGEINQLEVFGKNNSIYHLAEYAGLTTYELLVGLSNRILRKW